MPFLSHRSISFLLLVLNGVILSSNLCSGHGVEKSDSCPFSGHGSHDHEHHHAHHHHGHEEVLFRSKLPEELAEEEDLGLSRLDSRHSHKGHVLSGDHQLSKLDLWIQAMGCSLLVSMASLICLMILPVILLKGKPSKTMVDSLAAFGAGAMLGDAFLHQLPHAFGGGHLHSHDHHLDDLHDSVHDHGHSLTHSHSLEDLSVGLSILSGIVLFLLVEKIVRYVEDLSGKGADEWSLGHHHHRKNINKLKDDDRCDDNPNAPLIEQKDANVFEMASDKNLLDTSSDDPLNDEKHHEKGAILRKRRTSSDATGGSKDDANGSIRKMTTVPAKEPSVSSSSVFGYLNLFSDGVHNFTDGMALGSAFLLYGSVGGWSRTVFLLAHELPQEVGDFGILVRSGFSVSKALFFNFLSALVALAGTALALIIGQDPGQSSLLEGFTAGGFIYIAVAGVLPELNSVNTTLKNSVIHLFSLILGMAVALWISLVE